MTAVEQFIEQLEKQGDSWENVSIGRIQISIKVEDYLELQRQAKEMEKEQIMRTARQCYFEGVRKRSKTTEELIEYAEQYYNETFKSE
jgi:NCAIR mutase (PurE)-related protein